MNLPKQILQLMRESIPLNLTILFAGLWIMALFAGEYRYEILTSGLPAFIFALVGPTARPLHLGLACTLILFHAFLVSVFSGNTLYGSAIEMIVYSAICALIVAIRYLRASRLTVKSVESNK